MINHFRLWLTRLRHNLFHGGDFFTLVLISFLLMLPLFAMKTAGWQIEMRTLLPVTGVSLVFGYLLANSRYDELFALLLTTLYSLIVVVGIAGVNEPNGIAQGIVDVLLRTVQWIYDAITGGINQDDTVFTLLVGVLMWFMGYNAVWHLIRVERVWRAILPPATMLLMNLIVYTGKEWLDGYFWAFVVVVFLLIMRSALREREYAWYREGIRFPSQWKQPFVRLTLVIVILATLGVAALPQQNLEERMRAFQDFMKSDPFQEFADFFNRLFTPIEAEGPATADYYGSDMLNLGGAIKLGDQPILFVNAPNNPNMRYYWRSRVFERYDAGQWLPSSTWRVTDRTPPLEILLNEALIGRERVAITQTFTIANGGSRLLYALAQPSQISVGGRVDVVRVDESLEDLSPMNVSVMRPLRVLERGESYNAVSLVSTATADQLRNAGTTYPEWVSNPNAFIGLSVSQRVVQFARDIVTNANAVTPYDQAKAIETWLRQNIRYNENIPTPPRGIDPVDWFLFELKEGYCTYYATAMVTMLRSLGIPARISAGFSQGEWNAELGQFVVRERDAHTWVEVYFPNYGWIEFEPTSSEDTIGRGESPQPPDETTSTATPTTVATETPTAQPTMIPSPTPTLDRQEQDTSLPTLTPTPTPTPTPVIVPTVSPPVQPPQPPNRDFFSFLLPAIGVALLAFLLVLLLVAIGVFVWWWWEWRGMGGLSPIVRAYARLERYLALVGIRLGEAKTPDERRREIVKSLQDGEKPVSYIINRYQSERYGVPRQRTRTPEEPSEQAWQEARSVILRRWLNRFNPFKRKK